MTEFKFTIDRDGSFEPDDDWLLFKNPRLGTRGSPNIISGTGIAINAPRVVEFSDGPRLSEDDAQFIVCVATNFPYDTLGYGWNIMNHLTVVLVDGRTHETYSAVATRADRTNFREHLVPPPDDGKPDRTDYSKLTVGEALRANVAMMMDLPATETEYTVYASLGPYRSNTLTVKVVRRKPTPNSKLPETDPGSAPDETK